MSRVAARAAAPGGPDELRALWEDLARWPAFVDGFGHVVRVDDGWPAIGATLIWASTPHGRGRVIETVTGPGTSEVEDERLRGVQSIAFEPAGEGTRITLALAYELKERTVLTPVLNALFIRRALRDALQRTVSRLARERRGDAELL